MKVTTLQLKRALRTVLFVLLLGAVGMTKMYAYDFSAVCSTGQTLYYNITDTENHYVELTYPGTNQYNGWDGYTKPTGDMVLSENVQYDGISYSVTSIGIFAFYCCSGLTSVEIPNSVTSIGIFAFDDCSGLTSIEIPNSVTSISLAAFCGNNLEQIVVDPENTVYDSRNGCNAIINTSTNELVTGCKNTVIPNSVTSIGSYAFGRCRYLTSIEIPNSVTSIGSHAFYNIFYIYELEIPNSVISIGEAAFSYCPYWEQIAVDPENTVYDSRNGCNAIINTNTNELVAGCKNTVIPNSVTSIGSYAFGGCSFLTSIEIPNSVTSIGKYAFEACYMTSMTVLAETPPTLSENVFLYVSKNIPVYVPSGTIVAYQTSYGWNEFTNYHEIDINENHTISAICNPDEGGSVIGAGTYTIGETCTLIATANNGYSFINWTENGNVVSTNVNYTFSVYADRALTANFIYIGGSSQEYVDLSLPSGLLWATCNVGADAPEEYGDYFAWGETTPKDYYEWNTYQYCNGGDGWNTLTKYCYNSSLGYNGFTDTLTILLPEDDAATVNWGSGWRMPTNEDFQELYNNTTHIWTTLNGVYGRLFTSTNGNGLFLPSNGVYENSNLNHVGNSGWYWSSSLLVLTDAPYPCDAWNFGLHSNGCGMAGNVRCFGMSVRPVRSEPFNVIQASSDVKIYPNPSEGIFNIEGQNIRKVEVFNVLGQPVCSMDTENGYLKLDLTNRASGIYLIRIIS